MSSKPRPPPLNTIPSPVPSESTKIHEPPSFSTTRPDQQTVPSKPSNQQLKEQIVSMDCTDEQKAKIHKFLDLRDQIGELTNDDLSVEGELGSGNGGVVLKVRHRKLDVVMAKKVLYTLTQFHL